MIYIQTSDNLHTDNGQTTFGFSLCLCGETPILRKSLLVFYYYLKEKKVLVISENIRNKKEVKEKGRKKRAILKITE